jgi:T5SS/PEP-CTERM-associated repeat protein
MHVLASRRTRLARALALGLLFAAAAPAGAPAATSYYWRTAVDGSADDPAMWSPNGIPNGADYVNAILSGTYTITFPAGVANTYVHAYTGGNVSLRFLAPHATTGFTVRPSSSGTGSTTRITTGVLNTDYLELDGAYFPADFTLTGKNAEMHSNALVHLSGNGDLIGVQGTSSFMVGGGARMYSGSTLPSTWGLYLATTAASVATMSVAGYDPLTLATSKLYLVGYGDLTVGAAGTGTLNVLNGGQVLADHNVYVTRDPTSTGFVSVGSASHAPASAMNLSGNLGIGRQFFSVTTGRAELTIKDRGMVRVAGSCEVGSPAGDQGCFLRVLQGGTFIGTGGFRLWPTTGLGLDLRGGVMHLRGGAFTWPASRTLVVSSQVGTPELWIANGVANTGPSTSAVATGLSVGRGGLGTLRVSQPGTVWSMGDGATFVGDSLGGSGTFRVDSSASVSGSGDVVVGNRGNGVLEVVSGSSVHVKRILVGAQPSSDGRVTVRGPGSTLEATDNAWIGGTSISAGGRGLVETDSGAVVSVVSLSLPPSIVIYSNGALWATRKGHFETSGNLTCHGQLLLSDGEVTGTLLSLGTTGHLDGDGLLSLGLINAGRVDPFQAGSPFGRLHVTQGFTQTSAGRVRVDLGSTGARNDSLIVDGPLSLMGALDIVLDPSFVRVDGDTFTIARCGSRLGTFSSVTWNGNPLTEQAVVVYEPKAVRIAITPATTDVGPGSTGESPAGLRFAALSPSTGMAYELDLPEPADVQVRVYDLAGREVARLADGALARGRHRLDVPSRGDPPASGVYFARAVVRTNAGTVVRTARAVRLR